MALRTLVVDGSEWTAWDVYPAAPSRLRLTGSAAQMEQGWLCFECTAEKRRVAPIPAGWEEWGDDELEACLRGASRVDRRPGGPALAPGT